MSELANTPVQVITMDNRSSGKTKGVPLLMEFPVNPRLGPFLVSGSQKSTLWVRAFGNKVRAATREVPNLEEYFWEIINATIVKGREVGWGNIHPLSKDGLEAAISHVKDYDLNDLEILAHPDTAWGDIDSSWAVEKGDMAMALLGLPLQPTPWLHKGTLVVIPKDREYVGFVLLIGGRIASVVHNASRGVGIATSFTGGEFK